MIAARSLVRTFRRRVPRGGVRWGHSYLETVVALDDVSFEVAQGEIVGYVGSNGAGKSTTVKCLTGILVPTSGTVRVAGFVPHLNRTRNAHNVGVVFGQKSQLWWDVSARVSYDFLKSLYGLSTPDFTQRVAVLSEALGLDFLDVPVRQLSLGQRMRADLAAALLHSPRVLFLDEPTIGMDFESRIRLREFILSQNAAERTTVFLTTHDLEDINRMASRVLVLEEGRLIFDGTLDALKAEYAPTRTITVDLSEPVQALNLPEQIASTRVAEHTWHIDLPRTLDLRAVLERIPAALIRDVGVTEVSLDEVVRNLRVARGGFKATDESSVL